MVSLGPLNNKLLLPKYKQDVQEQTHGENHLPGRSSYLKTVVFGGLDGVLTMFSVVSGAAGASVSAKKLVCLSVASLLASSFSMGYGEYVSSKAEADYLNSEKAREEYEVAHCPEMEMKEMFNIYTNRYKFSKADAKTLVDVSFKYKDFFLRHMMVEELGIMLEDDEATPLKKSFLMALSFLVMGMFPVSGYLFLVLFGGSNSEASLLTFSFTVASSLLGSACLGYFKGKYLKQNRLLSSLYMTLNGVVVGFISYALGMLMSFF